MVRLYIYQIWTLYTEKLNSNQYFQNGAVIIDPVSPQNVPLTLINLPPQQTVLELTEIHENLTEYVWRA